MKSLKLIEVASVGDGKEGISITKVQGETASTDALASVPQSQLGLLIEVIALNKNVQYRLNSLTYVKRRCHLGITQLAEEANTRLQSFQGKADSLVKN